jgi:hypothetical protein
MMDCRVKPGNDGCWVKTGGKRASLPSLPHGLIQPFCSRIHITYSAAATAQIANAMEKISCLRIVMPGTVARRAASAASF